MSFAESSGSFTTHPATCSECGKPIAFRQGTKKPFDVVSNGSEYFQITDVSHFDSCPVKIRKRIEEKCAWCHFMAKENILSFVNLIDYLKCERHSNEKAEIQYRGKSLPMTNKTLHLMYDDALKAKKRKERMEKNNVGNQPLDTFVG